MSWRRQKLWSSLRPRLTFEYAVTTLHAGHPDDREITPLRFHSLSVAAKQCAWKEPSNDVNTWINTLRRLSFPCSKRRALHGSSWAELLPHFQGLRRVLDGCCCCWGTADVCLFSQTSPHVCHISPCLSNVLLIYTCWARGCIGIGCTLVASITQQALLLPFKTHLKRFAGVQPGAAAMILMCYCEECFMAWLETAGDLSARFFFFFLCMWAKVF